MTTRNPRVPKLDTLLTLDIPGDVLDTDTDSHGQPIVQRGPATTVRVWGGLFERVGEVVQPDDDKEFMRDRSTWRVRFSRHWRVGSTFMAWQRSWRVMSLKATDDRAYLELECAGT